jgi:hypothetical protein
MTTSRSKTRGKTRIKQAIALLKMLGMPKGQQNDRSALALLALANLPSNTPWAGAEALLLGITPIMEWSLDQYGKKWKPNTRESVRRRTIHQFVDAGIAQINPDDPKRPTNSQDTVYQLTKECLDLLQEHDSPDFPQRLSEFLDERGSLVAKYAMERAMRLIPVRMPDGRPISISAGKHSQLIKAIVEQFGSRFVPGGHVLYVGDTGKKLGHFDEAALASLGCQLDSHGKFPDVIIHSIEKSWLFLVEAVTTHGPVDPKRHKELAEVFRPVKSGLVYVTAFLDRKSMNKFTKEISWQTEVWVADSPSHLIHFDGERFWGPYQS